MHCYQACCHNQDHNPSPRGHGGLSRFGGTRNVRRAAVVTGTRGLEGHVIIPLNRVSASAAVPDGGSDGAVITAKRVEPVPLQSVPPEPANLKAVKLEAVQLEAVQPEPVKLEPVQLELSCRAGADGNQVVSVTGELDIATAEQAYAYISEVIDSWPPPVSVDLSGLTFCDASGLGVLAKIARHARQAGRQLRLTSARPSLLKIMRLTGLDGVFPELRLPVPAYSALASARPAPARPAGPLDRCAVTMEDAAR